MLALGICVLDGVTAPRLVSQVVEEAMADVDAFKDPLEVSDMIEKSTIKELNQ